MLDQPELSASKFHILPDGKRMRYALFEPKLPRGTVLAALGRREFIEKKYNEIGREFLERGFRLIIFEWRGQGLSDRFLTGNWRQRDHIDDFNIHLNDLDSLYINIVRPLQTGPLIVSGHSMGGHLMLRWVTERHPEDVAALFLTAPMLALGGLPVHVAAKAMSWTAVRLGHNADYALGQHNYGARDSTFDHNPLSHDPARFGLMERYFKVFPDLIVGGVTWGWLEASLLSMHHIQHRRYFDNMKLPLLSITGGADHVTPPLELSRVLKRIPSAEHIIVPDSLHDVMNETENFRLEAWKHVDGFLKKVCG